MKRAHKICRNKKCNRIFFIVMIGIISVCVLAWGNRSTMPTTVDIVCWEMPNGFLAQEKWERVPETGRQLISSRVARGSAEIKEETSFKCRQYRNGEMHEFLAKGQWWKIRK